MAKAGVEKKKRKPGAPLPRPSNPILISPQYFSFNVFPLHLISLKLFYRKCNKTKNSTTVKLKLIECKAVIVPIRIAEPK